MGVTAIKPEFTEDDKEDKAADQIAPQLPDDTGGDDEVDAELWPDDNKPLCTWSSDPDEHRRVFVFDKMADSDIAGHTLVENMDAVCKWLKDGTVPQKERKLKTVNKE